MSGYVTFDGTVSQVAIPEGGNRYEVITITPSEDVTCWLSYDWGWKINVSDSSFRGKVYYKFKTRIMSFDTGATDGDFDRDNWYYLVGQIETPNDTSTNPHLPATGYPVGLVNEPIWVMYDFNSPFQPEMLSSKSLFTGTVNISFDILMCGSGENYNTLFFAYGIKHPNGTWPWQALHYSSQAWDPSKEVIIGTSTTGYTASDTWEPKLTLTSSDLSDSEWTRIESSFRVQDQYVAIGNFSGYKGAWVIANVQIVLSP